MLMLTGIAAATAALPTIRVATAEAEPPKNADDALEKTLAAWEKRRAILKSFQYECDFKVNGFQQPLTSTPRRVDEGNPFGPTGDNIADVRGKFTLSRAGEKVAWIQTDDERRRALDKPGTNKRLSSYDTVHYQSLIQTFDFPPMGHIVPAAKLDKPIDRNAGAPRHALRDMVRKYGYQQAVWMWFTPVVLLNDMNFSADKMEVSRLHVRHNGRDCLEAVVPNPHKWQIVLYIDAARDYVPVGFVEQNAAGITKKDAEIQYVRDKDAGWRVLAWADKQFDESGKLYRSSSFEVKQCSINKPIRDEVFTWGFPKGVEVIDYDTDPETYFVSLGNGKHRRISKREYGALPAAPPAH